MKNIGNQVKSTCLAIIYIYIYIYIYISKHKESEKPINRQYLLKKLKVNISTSITCLCKTKSTNI